MRAETPLTEVIREVLRTRGGVPEMRDRLSAALTADAARFGGDDLPDRWAEAVAEALADVNRVSLIVTGLGWLGSGVRAIENTVIALVEEAQREVSIAAYSLTPGPARFWEALERAVDGGVRCTMVIDRLDQQHAAMRDWVRTLAGRHRATFVVGDFRGEDDNDHLHAKVVVADRERAIVGSANLTAHGLLLAHELALMVEGPAAEEIASRVDLLARSALVNPPS